MVCRLTNVGGDIEMMRRVRKRRNWMVRECRGSQSADFGLGQRLDFGSGEFADLMDRDAIDLEGVIGIVDEITKKNVRFVPVYTRRNFHLLQVRDHQEDGGDDVLLL